MGPRILDAAMTDEDYETLKKKLLETYSVRPTLLNPTVKRLVDWHCLESSCFLDNMVFDKREKWMRHHQRFHDRMCASDRGYPKEMEAKQFIQEYERRENARHGIAGAGGSAGLMPPTAATRAGPYSRISEALHAIPLNSSAPSSSTSGALCGASPRSAAPNSPHSGALRNSAAAGGRGPRGPYRLRANKAARRQEHPDQGFVNIAGGLQDERESFGTSDAAEREILMQQLSNNLQAVSRINEDSVHIMQILGMPSTNCVSEIHRPAGSKRPRESPNTGYPATPVATPVPLPTWVDRRALASTSRRTRGLQSGQSKFVDAASQAPAHVFEAPLHGFEAPIHIFEAHPYPSHAPAHSNEAPAHVFEATPYPYPSQAPAHRRQHPSHQALALSIGGPAAHSYEDPPLSIERPAHPYEAPALSVEGPAHVEGPALLALTYMTPSQPEEKEEEENYNAASDSERVDSDNNSDDEYIYQAADVSEDDDNEVLSLSSMPRGQVGWKDVKVEPYAAGSWP